MWLSGGGCAPCLDTPLIERWRVRADRFSPSEPLPPVLPPLFNPVPHSPDTQQSQKTSQAATRVRKRDTWMQLDCVQAWERRWKDREVALGVMVSRLIN